jgi:hypothetical protein
LPAGTLTLKYVLPETSACAISPLYPFSFKDRITLSARALSVKEPTCTHHFVSLATEVVGGAAVDVVLLVATFDGVEGDSAWGDLRFAPQWEPCRLAPPSQLSPSTLPSQWAMKERYSA